MVGRHLPALDGVRGIAMLAVLVFHLHGHMQYRFSNRPPQEALTATLFTISNYGWTGVDLFFVLSGFLITGILVDSREAENYYRAFYMRRALRIFPLYFGFLALFLLVVPLVARVDTAGFTSAMDNQVYLWTYCSNIAAAFLDIPFGPFSHFWSLAIEEHFYLFWPFVVRAVAPRSLALVCWLGIAVALASRAYFFASGAPIAAHMLMPCRLDAFALGSLCAIACRQSLTPDLRKRVATRLLGGTGLVIVLLIVLSTSSATAFLGNSLRYTLYALVSATLIWFAATSSGTILTTLLCQRPLRALGKYSYGLYVLHVPLMPICYVVLQRAFRAVGWQPTSELSAVLAFDVFASFCMVGAAMTSWHLFEKHILQLKRLFPYSSAPAQAVRAPAVVPSTD